ncbi:putative galactose oxidase [Helianthus annuus]|nr:putative galactose oxidase [Helianthus annuus]KAJ0536212.1 putative galactose oxidase [Helianthus annuus]KAJ0543891.1 putative galactose oxidase [Helianthus annuus]KAJ0708945.1 putative galactose oxidase [Helianthus annuus]KAJ0890032.1 putative galactose oxidase [Helianthus annuus]
MTSTLLYHHLLLSVILLLHAPLCPAAAGGSWSVLLPSIGISAMHMQLLPNDRVVMYDRTDFGISNISLPNGKCRPNSTDCSAHSVEYDVGSNTIRPLMVLTNVWCSSGTLMPDGSLVQTGGWAEGYRRVRIYKSCATCDWQEISNGLNQQRWYATNHLLPDGRQIIIGGRQAFNYEFYPKMSATENSPSFPFLVQTNDPNVENNLYPFVFLYPDGNLFVFANNRAILFNYSKNQVVKTYPTMPGGQPRNYPSTGSAVLLPLRMKEGVAESVEVLVCWGAPKGAFANANNGRFDGALDTCGRIRISDPNSQWVMETMPLARVMGVAGWELGRNPVLSPVTYRPDNQIGSRFEVQNPSTKPRVYHSTAVLLRDGRVLVGGSNPHDKYVFTNVLYPTELSLEAFSPSYLDPSSSSSRPRILSPKTKTKIRYGKRIAVTFTVPGPVDLNSVSVTIVSPSFNTHSLSMNQRLLVLDSANSTKALGRSTYRVGVTAPPSGNFAPAGHYLLYVVHKEIPSSGIWVRMQR